MQSNVEADPLRVGREMAHAIRRDPYSGRAAATLIPRLHVERVGMRTLRFADLNAGDDDHNPSYLFGDHAGVDASYNFARVSSLARGN